MKNLYFIVFIIFFANQCALAKQKEEWIHVEATEIGTDLKVMKDKALAKARKIALKQAGIQLSVSTLSISSAINKKKINDSFLSISESCTKGLIIDEKNIVIQDPVRVNLFTPPNDESILYQIKVELDILLAYIMDDPDYGFSVAIKSDKNSYKEKESVILYINSTRSGYLTLFNINHNLISVIFPNDISKDNYIYSNKTFVFPPTDIYSLELTLPENENVSNEIFVAVVTKKNIPFLFDSNKNFINNSADGVNIHNDQLINYSKWLYKIPVNLRCTDTIVLQLIDFKKR